MRLMVCGCAKKSFGDPVSQRLVRRRLKEFHARTPIAELIHDGGEGVAYHADKWARANNVLITACMNITEAFAQSPDLVLIFPGEERDSLIKKAQTLGLKTVKA